MNAYSNDLHFDVILPRLKTVSYKQVLLTFSQEVQKHLNISSERLYDLLIKKEEQTSSGIGDGIAIPHLQVRGPQNPITILATLEKPVDFNAVDNQPADVACLILSPESVGPYHLRRLSRISRLLKNAKLHNKLIDARDEQAIHALLIDPEGWLMAA